MFNARRKNLRSLERFLYRESAARELAIANDVADLVGVLIGVKPATMNDIPLKNADSSTLWRFTQRLEALNLAVIFYKRRVEDKEMIFYFVARSHKKAAELETAFQELWAKGKNPEVDAAIGALLGYPETAIDSFNRAAATGTNATDAYRDRILRNRFYAHSSAHEDEEFVAYERPIYRYMQRNCPKSARILKAEKQKRWLD